MKNTFISFILFLVHFGTAQAQTAVSISQLGTHAVLFTFEKNENPENIMIVYTKLDGACQVVIDPKNQASPVFDMYWLMNGANYKPVNGLIKSGVISRLQVVPGKSQYTFQIQINDLKELQTDAKDPKLTVVSQKTPKGDCEVKSYFTLGASDKDATMQVQTIYSEASKTFLPPFRKLRSVTLKGLDTQTGAKISRTYKAP